MPTPTPIGNIDESAIRTLAGEIKQRTRPFHSVYVLVDADRDVYAIRDGQGEAIFEGRRSGLIRVGVYTSKATLGAIAEDLICARDEEMAGRRVFAND